MSRILVKSSLSYDGVASVTMNYFKEISSHDFRIDFYTNKTSVVRDDYKNEIINSKKSHIYYYNFGFKNIFSYIFKTYKLLRNYEVYHVNGSSANITLDLMIALFAGVKIRIAHSHSTNCKYRFFHFLLKPLLPFFSTSNIACSLSAAKWMFSNKKFTILYNGIDTSLFSFNIIDRIEIRKKYNIDKSKKILLNIGFLYEVKNQELLIEIQKKILDYSDDYILIIIGTGVLYDKLLELRSSLNLSDSVLILGNTNEIHKFYSAADIFILTSHFEGLPVTLVEAQYNGLNCVFPNHVTEEVVINKKNCHILDLAKGPEKWAEYIKDISITDRKVEVYDSRFDIKKNVLDLEKIYTGVNYE
jgi:glycosyltransferase involved in cell wall biosynthesis